MLDASVGGALVDKTPMAAKTLIANRALNAQQYEGVGQRDTPRHQVNEVSFTSDIQSQLVNLTSIVSQMVEGMRMKEPSVCGVCSIQGHASEKCPQLIENGGWESANAIGFQGQNQPRNDPYSNTYNPSWRDHPNFREQGKLPSSTIVNPKGGFESAKAISLRIGKQVGFDPQPSNSRSNEVEELIIKEEEQSTPTERVETPLPQAPKAPKPSNSANKGELKNDGVIIQLADRSNAYPKGVLEDVLVQVNHLIFPTDFYVLEMDESDHSPTLPILLGRPFMKMAQTKIDVAKGSVTMAFGGDMINFNIPKYVENTNDVRFFCAIDVIENIRQKRSTLIKKKVPRTTIEEEIGVNNKECTTTPLKAPILIESNPCAFVDSAATSLQHIGTSPNPISIPISTNRLLPSMVQVPNRMQGSREGYINCWKQHTKIRKDYYPVPFKDSMCEHFEEHVVENVPLHVVGPVQA
ncbi:unnamed protein product [Malus baccata var. baccata]